METMEKQKDDVDPGGTENVLSPRRSPRILARTVAQTIDRGQGSEQNENEMVAVPAVGMDHCSGLCFLRVPAMIGGARVRLNGWQQAAVALGSAVGALLDPRRADLIAALGETTGKPAFERVLERMKKSPEGRAVLLERPRVISANVGHAWDLPENTFGAAYANFMGSRNFSPDDRPPVRFMDSEELAYVAMRAREVHDFWHTLFDLPTNLMGESALKVIEFQQMHLPMCFMSIIGGSARFNSKQRSLFFEHYFPWALRTGMNCADLMCVYYERHFDEDLGVVRRNWGIIPAPPPPAH